MRTVTFIRSLNVDQVRMLDKDSIRYHMMEPLTPCPTPGGDEFMLTTAEVQEMVVPVHMLRTGNRFVRDTLYIAYSKDVQDLLGMPFDVMKRELDEARGTLSKMREANWRARLRFLFTRRLWK